MFFLPVSWLLMHKDVLFHFMRYNFIADEKEPCSADCHLYCISVKLVIPDNTDQNFFGLALVSLRIHGHKHLHARHRGKRHHALGVPRTAGHEVSSSLPDDARHKHTGKLSRHQQHTAGTGQTLMGHDSDLLYSALLYPALPAVSLFRPRCLNRLF